MSNAVDSSPGKGQILQPQSQTSGYQEVNRATVRLVLWTLAWGATLALAKFGSAWWGPQPAANWIAIAINLVVGIGWIVAHIRFLREIDELQRKIMQDALAITLGIGLVGGFAWEVADNADILNYHASAGLLPMLLGAIYIVANVVGHIRYR